MPKKKPLMTVAEAIDQILDAELSVCEHENNSCSHSGTSHITILGGKRRVEFWPSTGSVYADKGDFAHPVRAKGIRNAIKLAKAGRL